MTSNLSTFLLSLVLYRYENRLGILTLSDSLIVFMKIENNKTSWSVSWCGLIFPNSLKENPNKPD